MDTSSHFDPSVDQWVTARPPKELAEERSIWIRGYYRDTKQESFAIHLASPASPLRPQPVLDLKPRPMPQTFTEGGFSAVLKSAAWVQDRENSHYGAEIGGVDSRNPGVEWTPVSLAMEDRYGRRIESIDPSWRRFMAGDGFEFFGLCRKEPAWKLLATLAREPWSPGAPDYVWEVPEMIVVRGYGKQKRNLRNGQHRLEVSQPASWGAWKDDTGRERRLVRVHIQTGKPWRECRLLVTHINGVETSGPTSERLTPDGRELPSYVTDVTNESKGSGRFYLPVAPNVQSLRLRVAEYGVRRAEFVIKPPE